MLRPLVVCADTRVHYRVHGAEAILTSDTMTIMTMTARRRERVRFRIHARDPEANPDRNPNPNQEADPDQDQEGERPKQKNILLSTGNPLLGRMSQREPQILCGNNCFLFSTRWIMKYHLKSCGFNFSFNRNAQRVQR